MNLHKLSVATYNCRSIKSSRKDVQNLCDICDIVLVQETWLTQQNLDFLQTVSSTHFSYEYSPVNDKLGIRKGRPFGGTAIFCKKDLKAERVVSHTGEIIGVRITSFVESVVFINVYFPYCCNQNQENFDSYLG